MSKVSFVKLQNYELLSSLKNGISASLNLINYSFGEEISNIVIKPNLCYYWDHTTGQTTDPQFVAALIELIRDKLSDSVKISIVESDASAMKCKHAFRLLGYEQLVKDYNVRLVNLSEDESEGGDFIAGRHSFHLQIPRTIREANLKINLPKIKYSVEQLKITCALKNIFGCNPFQKKFVYHKRLGEAIVALNKAMGFDLCLIDGNVVSGVHPRRLGLIMASTDPVSIDAAAARIAGINPRRIRYLKLASEEGLGHLDFVSSGCDWKYFAERYPAKSARNKIMRKASDVLIFTGLNKKIGL